MTKSDLSAALEELGWSARRLSVMLGCDRSLCLRWLSGRGRVPPAVAAWLAARVSAAQSLPPPTDWRMDVARRVMRERSCVLAALAKA